MLLQQLPHLIRHLHAPEGALAFDPGVQAGRHIDGQPLHGFGVTVVHPFIRLGGVRPHRAGPGSESYFLAHVAVSFLVIRPNSSSTRAMISRLAKLVGSFSSTVPPFAALSAKATRCPMVVVSTGMA